MLSSQLNFKLIGKLRNVLECGVEVNCMYLGNQNKYIASHFLLHTLYGALFSSEIRDQKPPSTNNET